MVSFNLLHRFSMSIGPQSLICCVVGIVFGFFLAILFTLSTNIPLFIPSNSHSVGNEDYLNATFLMNATAYKLSGHTHVNEYNHSLADTLYKEVRVLCLVMTSQKNYESHAVFIQRTWGSRCNKMFFMGTPPNFFAPLVQTTNSGEYGWTKVKAAFKYVYENNLNDADWFLKVDDKSYVIMENLRYMLYRHSPEKPLYFGRTGEDGYVVSKKALELFVEKTSDTNDCEPIEGIVRDTEIKCLGRIGIKPGDTNDLKGRPMLLQFPQLDMSYAKHVEWRFWQGLFHQIAKGFDGCSDNVVSFRYVTPPQMYALEFLVYHLRPYGIDYTNSPLPLKFNWTSERSP